jgi:uncharacterized membrane protein YjjP (DUF1212 family)
MSQEPPPPQVEIEVLLEFMFRLGQAYLASGEQTAQAELFLRRIATAWGVRRSRIVAFPSAIFISVDDGTGERVTLAEGPLSSLRLDQIADVYTLGTAVRTRELTPAQGLERLAEIMRQAPRFGAVGHMAGHATLAIGLAMVLMPSWPNLLAAAILGTLIGGLKALKRTGGVLDVPLSVVAALIVSFLAFFAAKQGLPIDPRHALIPPLVTFLPGAMLAMGMVELAYGDMVSGTSRLVNGFVQLVLLAFGLVGGAALAGVSPGQVFEASIAASELAWVPWLGVLIFGVGVHIHFCAPKNALGWLLLVLLTTFAAQLAATGFVGNEFSGFFGALVAVPLAYLIRMRFRGPPMMVTFLPSFWLLVPGALGLISVKSMLSDRAAGLEGLTTAVFVFASIALGTLLGAAIYKQLTEYFGAWQLQIGRVGRKPAKTKKAKPDEPSEPDAQQDQDDREDDEPAPGDVATAQRGATPAP